MHIARSAHDRFHHCSRPHTTAEAAVEEDTMSASSAWAAHTNLHILHFACEKESRGHPILDCSPRCLGLPFDWGMLPASSVWAFCIVEYSIPGCRGGAGLPTRWPTRSPRSCCPGSMSSLLLLPNCHGTLRFGNDHPHRMVFRLGSSVASSSTHCVQSRDLRSSSYRFGCCRHMCRCPRCSCPSGSCTGDLGSCIAHWRIVALGHSHRHPGRWCQEDKYHWYPNRSLRGHKLPCSLGTPFQSLRIDTATYSSLHCLGHKRRPR